MKKSKFIINIFIILVVLSIVLYFSLRDNYVEIIDAISHMKVIYIFLAIISLILYRLFISLTHMLVIHNNGEKIKFLRCFQINLIILFFHGVTPFAGGGQPMEVYYLHNEKIPVTKATNITLQNFIVYQISLILIGIFSLVYNYFGGIFPNNDFIKRLVLFGFLINFLVLVVTFILSFGKKINHLVCEKVIKFLAKIKIIRDEEKIRKKTFDYLTQFHSNALILKEKKLFALKVILIDCLALIILYSMPFIVACGLNIDLSLMEVIVATSYVMIIGSFVPIPGGTGGVEYGFLFFFGYFLSGGMLHALMLIWRFISYYLGMIFGGIALSFYRKRNVVCE